MQICKRITIVKDGHNSLLSNENRNTSTSVNCEQRFKVREPKTICNASQAHLWTGLMRRKICPNDLGLVKNWLPCFSVEYVYRHPLEGDYVYRSKENKAIPVPTEQSQGNGIPYFIIVIFIFNLEEKEG